MSVHRLTAAAGWLQQASGLAAVLDAACNAFEEILAAIGNFEEVSSEVNVPLVLAATQAANGRDAILFAPSLPPRCLHQPRQPGEGPQWGSTQEKSAVIANLSMLLAAQLARTAGAVATGADWTACQDAAGYARAVHDLLARTGR